MNSRILRSLSAALVALLLAACSSTAAQAGPPRFGFGFRKGTTTVSVPTITPAAVTYDTSMGTAVDANGFASLPLRTGAKAFYVNATTGSDSNTCTAAQSPTTPKASINSVTTNCITHGAPGAGDHILLAQDTTYTINAFGNITNINGFSPQYPFAVESYDPADPTNQAKWGHATGTHRPAVNTSGTHQSVVSGADPMKYIAIRGIAFNMDSTTWKYVDNSVPASGTNDYILYENDIFHYTQLDSDQTQVDINGPHATKFIVRNCAIYAGEQGLYIAATNGVTVEDNVFWHNGWAVGAARTDPSPAGPNGFEHAIYAQSNADGVYRRNAFVDTASDGGNIKGGGIYQDNLDLRNPIAFSLGSGNEYSVAKPFGSWIDASFNAVIGSNTQSDPYFTNGWGVTSNDGRPNGSAQIHHNVVVRNDFTTTNGLFISGNTQDCNYGCYLISDQARYHHNVGYLWNVSGQAVHFSGGTNATEDHNTWDDPTSGTDTNNGSVTFANAYTEATLISALGYASEAAAVNDWIANPEQHKWEPGPTLVLTGYGVTKAQADLSTDMRLTIGLPSQGLFIGTIDGDSIAAISGAPTGLIIDSSSRRWIYDGTGSPASGNMVVRATNGSNTHNSTIAWASYNRPVLSSLSVTPGTTTAAVNVSANVGSGSVYAIADTRTQAASWPQIRAGYIAHDSPATAAATASVTATGAQSPITLSGLTASTGYRLQIAQVDANHNASVVSSYDFTTAGSFSPASLSGLKLWVEADPTKLYTDAGTTLVSADGQAVQQANDKSGNGFHLTQATLGSRPLYKTGSGHPYLLFNGTSSDLDNSNATLQNYTDGSGQVTIAFVGQAGSDITSNQYVAMLRTNAGAHQLRFYIDNGAIKVYSSTNVPGAPIETPISANTKFVVIAHLTTSQLSLILNNGTPVTTAVSGALDTASAAMWLGSNINAANFCACQVKAVVVVAGTMTGTDDTNLYNYLNTLSFLPFGMPIAGRRRRRKAVNDNEAMQEAA